MLVKVKTEQWPNKRAVYIVAPNIVCTVKIKKMKKTNPFVNMLKLLTGYLKFEIYYARIYYVGH